MLDSLNSILLAAEQGIKYETAMNVLMAFVILMVIAAVAIIVVIMMQKAPTTTWASSRAQAILSTERTRQPTEKAFSKSHVRFVRIHYGVRNHLLRDVEICWLIDKIVSD